MLSPSSKPYVCYLLLFDSDRLCSTCCSWKQHGSQLLMMLTSSTAGTQRRQVSRRCAHPRICISMATYHAMRSSKSGCKSRQNMQAETRAQQATTTHGGEHARPQVPSTAGEATRGAAKRRAQHRCVMDAAKPLTPAQSKQDMCWCTVNKRDSKRERAGDSERQQGHGVLSPSRPSAARRG
jgi:hypothetical protein